MFFITLLEALVAHEQEWRKMAEERLALVTALPAPRAPEPPRQSRRWFWPWGKG